MSAPQAIRNPKNTFVGQPFATKDIVAFAHANEEHVNSIKEALRAMRFTTFDQYPGRTNMRLTNGSAIFSSVVPRFTISPRSEHMSVSHDGLSPCDAEGNDVYPIDVWPYLL
jgi:hypothetical protein